MRTCTLVETFWMRLRRSRATSSLIPALSWISICPRPLPTVFGSPALNSLADSWRRAAFSRSTCTAARARSSVEDSMTITVPRWSYVVAVSLKSNLVWTSRRAWSIALVSSAGLNSETTSNEYSATAVEDRVEPGDHRHDGQGHAHQRRDGKQSPDSGGALVQRFRRGLVVRVGPVVQVVHALRAGLLHELVEDGLASRRQGLTVEVGDGPLEVVAGLAQLGRDEVERLQARGGGVLAPKVGDDAVQAHVWNRNRHDPASTSSGNTLISTDGCGRESQGCREEAGGPSEHVGLLRRRVRPLPGREAGPDDSRAALRHRGVRRHSGVLEPAQAAAVPAPGARALRADAPLGKRDAHGASAFDRGARQLHARGVAAQRVQVGCIRASASLHVK